MAYNMSSSVSSPRSSDLPDFRTRFENLPDRLYRVHCPGRSNTSYTQSGGFRCSRKRGINIKGQEFIPTLTNHLNWYSKSVSPFISTFSRESHAYGWATMYFQNHPNSDKVEIMEIDPREIRNDLNKPMPVISVKKVVDRMHRQNVSVIPSKRTPYQIEDEYVCLYIVPARAIVRVEMVSRDELIRDEDSNIVEDSGGQVNSGQAPEPGRILSCLFCCT
ncbi:hypothetical protein TWF281_011581 [Arthrobotrys megalospora]